MSALTRCLRLLETNNIPYSHSIHSAAYTARDVAWAERMPAHNMVKVVIYRGDNGFGMLLLPADYVVDFGEVLRLLGLTEIRLATEAELAELFPDSEVGAMPPIGNEIEVPMLVDESLAEDDFIGFSAGTHRDVIHISFEDFVALTNPLLASFAVKETVLAR
jgi:Ala-tRNA(Pro) deacylase